MEMFPILICVCLMGSTMGYDPEDDSLKEILPPEGQFEAFYPSGSRSNEEGAARPSHLHGSFNNHRNPALVEVQNSPAYGFRFDGKRRFNYD